MTTTSPLTSSALPRGPRSGLRLVADVDGNEELLRAAAEGSRYAWETLVHRYSRLLWSVARRFRLGESETGDVVQTVWLRLAENIGQVREPDRLPLWLSKTTRRECLRRLTGRQRLDGDSDLSERPDASPGPEQIVVDRDEVERLRAALARLAPRDQQLLLMLTAERSPNYRAIAAALRMPVGSIGPSRARALARLRREFEAQAERPFWVVEQAA